MEPLYKKIAFGIVVLAAVAGIVLLGRTGKSIELGNSPENGEVGSGAQIQAVSGSNSGLFRDTFNTSGSETGVSTTESKVSDAEKSFDQRNLTERISIDLFAKYLILKNNGQEITPELQANLVNNVIEENTKKIEYITYTGANLGLISSPTPDQIRTYGNALATLIVENSPKNLAGNELSLLAKMAEGGANSEDLDNLRALADAYEKIGQKLVQMTIPSDAKPLQVVLANVTGRIGVNIAHFAVFESDPATAISHLSAYDQNVTALNAALKSVGQYFTKKGIVFSTKDPGYAFTLIGQ
ncbi:MAG: hypothetical protein WCO79_00200 [bacterium]